MKRVVLIIVCCVVVNGLAAQVVVRNDFVISTKNKKRVENRGVSLITINLGSYPNWNQLINGRGGRTMVIDMQAVRHPQKVYTYQQIAERVYVPPTVSGPFISRVPAYLLVPPPLKRLSPRLGYRGKRG